MRNGLNLQDLGKIVKRHYLNNMLHPDGTPEGDMILLVNEIMRLRGILKKSNKASHLFVKGGSK